MQIHFAADWHGHEYTLLQIDAVVNKVHSEAKTDTEEK